MQFQKYLGPLLFLPSLCLAGYVEWWAWLNISADYPMEYRENTVLLTCDLLLQGQNPFSVELRPVHINVYGIGFYWVAYPFTVAFGNSYLVLRLISVAFVIASCALLVWALRGMRLSCWFCLTAGLLLFSQLAQGLSIVARPDGVGLFFFLASIIVPYRFKFSVASLSAGAVLSILGFLTKPYFVLGIPLIVLYLFLFEGKSKAAVFAVLSGGALLLVALLINAVYECYFTETFFMMRNSVGKSLKHLRRVGSDYLRQNFGLILALILAIIWRLRALFGSGASASGSRFDLRHIHRPLLLKRASFPVLILCCHIPLIVFTLGQHPGNDTLYYHQLITPFLLWGLFELFPRSERLAGAMAAALVLINTVTWLVRTPPLPKDHSAAWRELERLVNSHTSVFTAPPLSHVLWRKGAPIYDNGLTEYLFDAFRGNTTAVVPEYRTRTQAFLDDLRVKVRERKFDLVIVARDLSRQLPYDDLQRNYVLKSSAEYPMTFGYWVRKHPLQIWVPASAPQKP